MIEKNLNSGTLVTVLVLGIQEDTIEPFRLQPSLTLVVDFTEYLKFCRTELGFGYDWLSTSTGEIQYYIRELDHRQSEMAYKKLFKAFLRDIAFGQLKEIAIAEAVGQGATGIRHSVNSPTILDEAKIEEHYVNLSGKDIEIEMFKELSNKAISLTKVSAINAKHYKYALVTYCMAGSGLIWSSK